MWSSLYSKKKKGKKKQKQKKPHLNHSGVITVWQNAVYILKTDYRMPLPFWHFSISLSICHSSSCVKFCKEFNSKGVWSLLIWARYGKATKDKWLEEERIVLIHDYLIIMMKLSNKVRHMNLLPSSLDRRYYDITPVSKFVKKKKKKIWRKKKAKKMIKTNKKKRVKTPKEQDYFHF